MKIFTVTSFCVPKLFACMGVRACTETHPPLPTLIHAAQSHLQRKSLDELGGRSQVRPVL